MRASTLRAGSSPKQHCREPPARRSLPDRCHSTLARLYPKNCFAASTKPHRSRSIYAVSMTCADLHLRSTASNVCVSLLSGIRLSLIQPAFSNRENVNERDHQPPPKLASPAHRNRSPRRSQTHDGSSFCPGSYGCRNFDAALSGSPS